MKTFFTKHTPSCVSLFFVAATFFIASQCGYLLQFDTHILNHLDGERLLTGADSWYYLRRAGEMLSGTFVSYDVMRPLSPYAPYPFISAVTVWLSNITGLSLSTVAFFIPVVGSLLCIPVMWLWCSELKFRFFPALVASVFPLLSYAWASRIHLGRFDTDFLIIPLTMLALWAVYCFSRWQEKFRFVFLLSGLLSLLVLFFWWQQGALAVGAVAIASYLLSFPLSFSFREKRIQLGLILFGLVLFGLALTPLTQYFPAPFQGLVAHIKAHIALILGKEGTALFPSISETIGELTVGSLFEAIEWVSGNVFVFSCALVGLLLAFGKNRTLLFFIGVPVFCFFLLSLTGRRFLMFLTPFIGLGAGFFIEWVQGLLEQKKPQIALFSSAVLAFCFVGSLLFSFFSHDTGPVFDANRAVLAKNIDRHSPADTKVWSWWGDGYFIQYFAKRPTFIDGGSQTPMRAWLMSVPMASSDPVFVRNWIRFFAAYPYALEQLARRIGMQKATTFFLEVFKEGQDIQKIASQYDVAALRDWSKYLFPDVNVVLYLPSDMMVKGTWLTVGKWLPGVNKKPYTPIYSQPTAQAVVKVKEGTIAFRGNVYPFSKLLVVEKGSLAHYNGQEAGPVFITLEGISKMYFMEQKYFDCLVFRLLFMYPDTTPNFKPLAYNPFVGGAWLVQ
jgi:dolichyl-diphosphooligosaccharide--protein glycosyltransferase